MNTYPSKERKLAEVYQSMIDELTTVTKHPSFKKLLKDRQRAISWQLYDLTNKLNSWSDHGDRKYENSQHNLGLDEFYNLISQKFA